MSTRTKARTITKPKSRTWVRCFVAGLALTLTLLTADYFLYPQLSPMGGRSFNVGKNGLWLRDSWYLGKEKEAPGALADRLEMQQMRYAYLHVRFIKKEGKLRYREDATATRRLTDTLHKRAPNVKLIAWIYIGNARGLTGVDLSSKIVRKAIIGEAQWLTRDCGFDGVQYDYEICEDGNTDFLSLLAETHAALPTDKMLCVSSPMWVPGPLHQWGWSENYFAKVAANCDQIAVMAYDSGLYLPRAYVWLVQQQAIRVTRSAARGNPGCRVLLGIPTYRDGGPSHSPHAEKISLALKGVREGMASPDANVSVFDGVAIFADYTTNSEDWDTYQRLWLTPRARARG